MGIAVISAMLIVVPVLFFGGLLNWIVIIAYWVWQIADAYMQFRN
jgi:hypothetical protein